MGYGRSGWITTRCTRNRCGSSTTYDGGSPGAEVVALSGWLFGVEQAVCPNHAIWQQVLDRAV